MANQLFERNQKWTLTDIVKEMEKCDFQCEDGYLNTSAVFLALKEHARITREGIPYDYYSTKE